MLRQELLYICSRFIGPFPVLAPFSEGPGFPRTTTSHARCKEVRHGRVSFGLFLSDLN